MEASRYEGGAQYGDRCKAVAAAAGVSSVLVRTVVCSAMGLQARQWPSTTSLAAILSAPPGIRPPARREGVVGGLHVTSRPHDHLSGDSIPSHDAVVAALRSAAAPGKLLELLLQWGSGDALVPLNTSSNRHSPTPAQSNSPVAQAADCI